MTVSTPPCECGACPGCHWRAVAQELSDIWHKERAAHARTRRALRIATAFLRMIAKSNIHDAWAEEGREALKRIAAARRGKR